MGTRGRGPLEFPEAALLEAALRDQVARDRTDAISALAATPAVGRR